MLFSIIWEEARFKKTSYIEGLDNLLDMLNNIIRLGTILEESKKNGKPKTNDKLDEMTEAEKNIMIALGMENTHNERPKIKDIGVYKYIRDILMCTCILQRLIAHLVINSR